MGDFAVDDETLDIDQAVLHLYQNRMFTDFQVIVLPGNEVYYVHKLILSVFSPVLCDRFYGKDTDDSGILHVQDVDISAVSNMISYFYGETLVLENIFQISETKKIADRYKIYELSNKCKSKIYELDVDVSNVLAILEIAVQYENKTKERECLEIIGRNQEAVFESEAFTEMKFENVCGIFEDLRQMGHLTEVHYLRSALRWMGCEIDAHKNKLIDKIEISKLSWDEFIDVVIEFPCFLTNTEISHAMKEIKSVNSTMDDTEGASGGILSNNQRNGISEKKTKLNISIMDGEAGIKKAIIIVEDEIGRRGLQFEVTGDLKEGLLESLSVGDHTFDNVDISYEGLYFMMTCLKHVGVELSSVNSVEAFKAAVYFQLQKLQDILLTKIGSIIDYDPVFLDSLRCLIQFIEEMPFVNSVEDSKTGLYFLLQKLKDLVFPKIGNFIGYDPVFLRKWSTFFRIKLPFLIYRKSWCVILHPNFIHCSVQLLEIVLELHDLYVESTQQSEMQLLLVTIDWLEARNRLRWDSRSSLLNKIAFENISSSDLSYVTKYNPYFFTDNEVNSILLHKDGTNITGSRVSLPEWYNFKARGFLQLECDSKAAF